MSVEYRNLGCVGFDRYAVGDDGTLWRLTKQGMRQRVLSPEPRYGYLITVLSQCGKRKTFTIHRLVMEAFVGPKPDGMQCCHNDGNPANNCLSNLRWDTVLSNQHDRYKHGTHVRGEKNPATKVTSANVREIRDLYKTNEYTCVELGVKFGLSKAQINKIVNHKVWGCLP